MLMKAKHPSPGPQVKKHNRGQGPVKYWAPFPAFPSGDREGRRRETACQGQGGQRGSAEKRTVTVVSPAPGQNAPSATLLVFQRNEVYKPQLHRRHGCLSANSQARSFEPLAISRSVDDRKVETRQTSKARSDHLNMVSILFLQALSLAHQLSFQENVMSASPLQ